MSAATALRPGDLVDLEGDPYAERPCEPGCDDCGLRARSFPYELERVLEVEIETPGCTVVHFESGLSVGFPTDHELAVRGDA